MQLAQFPGSLGVGFSSFGMFVISFSWFLIFGFGFFGPGRGDEMCSFDGFGMPVKLGIERSKTRQIVVGSSLTSSMGLCGVCRKFGRFGSRGDLPDMGDFCFNIVDPVFESLWFGLF